MANRIIRGNFPASETIAQVNTVAELKALDVNLIDSVNLLGYFAAGDNKSRLLVFNSSSTATDNGGTVFIPTFSGFGGTGRWLYETSEYDVRDFGAKGDGTTDDSTTIQATINAMTDNSTLLISGGKYRVGTRLEIRGLTGILIHGDGQLRALTTLYADPSIVNFILRVVDCIDLTIAGLQFQSDLTAIPVVINNANSCLGIQSNIDTRNITIRDVKFRFFSAEAIILDSAERDEILFPGVVNPALLITTTSVSIVGCVFEDTWGGFITYHGGISLFTVSNNHFRNMPIAAVKIDGQRNETANVSQACLVTGNTFYNCSLIQPSIALIEIQEHIKDVVISNNLISKFVADVATISIFAIDAGQTEKTVDNIIISNNFVTDSSYFRFLRVKSPDLSGENDISSITVTGNILNGNTQVEPGPLIVIENSDVVNLTVTYNVVEDTIDRFVVDSGSVNTYVAYNRVQDVVDTFFQQLTSTKVTLEFNTVRYGLQIFDTGSANFTGILNVYQNVFERTGTSIVDSIWVNGLGNDVFVRVNNNVFSGVINAAYVLNVHGEINTALDSTIFCNNYIENSFNGVRSVSHGVVANNVWGFSDPGGSLLINFKVDANGLGFNNIVTNVGGNVAVTNYTTLSSGQIL